MPLPYSRNLKQPSRDLRTDMTDAEQKLWSQLRRRQILGIQFYRQKPIGQHIVDSFAPRAKLVVDVDGAQHLEADHALKDRIRGRYLASIGLKVLRFNSRDVLMECDEVVEVIYRAVAEHLKIEIPPSPPL